MANRTIFNRVWNLFYTNTKRLFSSYYFDNNRRWKELKDKYKGKRVFLIANGPSLNITPLYLLRNEYTIMFNRIILMLERLHFTPTFYMVSDALVAPTIIDDIQYFVENSQITFSPDIHKGDMIDFTKFVPYSPKVLYTYDEPVKFSNNLPYIGGAPTVIYRAFQILAFLGFDEVVVVGNDMNYVIQGTAEVKNEMHVKGNIMQHVRSKKDDDPNHFDPRYFGKGKEYHQPTSEVVSRIFKALDVVADEYKKLGKKVINAGYNSRVNSFPKQEFYQTLNYSQDKIDSLFEELVKSKGFDSLTKFFDLTVTVDSLWEGDLKIAAVPISIASEVVPKKVVEYLPLGPYKGYVYMVNRELLINKAMQK